MPTIRRLLPLLALSAARRVQRQRQSARPDRREHRGHGRRSARSPTPRSPPPSGFSVTVGADPHRPGPELRLRLRHPGRPGHRARACSCPAPRSASPPDGSAEPGLMRRDETFDDIEAAPSNGYVTDEAVPDRARRALHRPLPRHLRHRRAALRQGRDHRPGGQFASSSRSWRTPTAATAASSPASPTADPHVIDLKRLRQDPEGSRASLLRRRDPSVAESVDALLDARPRAAGACWSGWRRSRPSATRRAKRSRGGSGPRSRPTS